MMYKLSYVTMSGETVATDSELFATKKAALLKGLVQIADGFALNLYIQQDKKRPPEGYFFSWKKLNARLLNCDNDINQVVAEILSE